MTITYRLVRSERKTLALHLRDGVVEVRAPLRLPQSKIDEFVRSKQKWIERHLAAAKEQHERKQVFTVSYGSMLLWRGREYPLLGDSDNMRMWQDEQGFHFPPGLDAETLKYNVVKLYKACARDYLNARLRHFAALMKLSVDTMRITNAQTRWGSCSRRKNEHGNVVVGVNFSWRLCMAEDDVIDAVVVHELAHITEMNHSHKFYAMVKSVLPDYDKRDAKLKALSKRLGFEDWSV
jgi:predicted metal-dependent hydrolase